MKMPRILINTNVELTTQQKHLVQCRLIPLARVFSVAETVQFVLSVRQDARGEPYRLSVKLKVRNMQYVCAVSHVHLSKALLDARAILRKRISRGASVEPFIQEPQKEESLVELLVV